LKISKIKFLTFFTIICSIGLAPINDAYAATTFVDSFDVSSQDIGPQGVAFNSDGTKMFVLGNAGDDVNEYACTTGFDVSTCSFTDAFSVSGQESIPAGFTFNSDGTKMFVTGFTGDDVNEYACTTGFDVSTCSFTDAFSVSGQETRPSGVAFNSDGTKMFVTGTVGDAINEYACTTGFDVSTCSFTDAFDVSGQDTEVSDVTFNTDGTKMFVLGTVGDDVNEYACTTGFDVSTCSFTDYFSVAIHDTAPTGVTFNSDGTKMFVLGATDDDVNEYTLEVGFDFNGVTAVEDTTTTKKSSSDCYDCKPPVLQSSHITISSNEYVVATGDDPLHITAHVGDKVTVILNVTDNKSISTIPYAALYTNFQEKPDSMNAFYANNFDKWKQVSTSFYQWNVRADDVAYDYDGIISWDDNSPTVVTDEITEENYFMINDDNVLEYFMMPFTFTMNDSMEESAIIAKIYDNSGNRLHVTLPVTLEIIQKETSLISNSEEIATLDKGDVIVTPSEDKIPLLNEPVLLTVLSQWSGYSQEESTDTELLASLGLQGESLPAWTKNLGEWVVQEKLDVSELTTAIQYVNNQ